MLRQIYYLMAGLTTLGTAGFYYWLTNEWRALSATPDSQILTALEAHNAFVMSLSAGLLALAVLTYLASFDGKRRRRPYIQLFLLIGAAGSTIGIPVYLPLLAIPTREAPEFAPAVYGIMAGGALGLVLIAGLFELANRLLWPKAATYFDKKEWSSLAMFSNRMGLLFKPGQESTLRTVALARFRRGARGDVVATIQTLYDAGVRDIDVLEALCKYASESKDSKKYLTHLRELQELAPDDDELQELLVEELIDQRFYDEAIEKLEEFELPGASIEWLERYARLQLVQGRIEQACATAQDLADQEGIPFKRSQVILRELLSRVSEYVPALNLLAQQASRMKQREQRVRWLEQSLSANSRQTEIRQQLIEIYRETENFRRLEDLILEEVRENPGNKAIFLELAKIQNDNGKVQEALESLDQMIESDKAPAEAFLMKAQLQYDNKAYTDALKTIEGGLKADGGEFRGKLLNLQNKVEQAILTVEVAEKLEKARANPSDFTLQMEALELLIEGGHVDKIIGLCDEMSSHHPNRIGEVLARLQNYAENPEVPFPILNLMTDLQTAAGHFDAALTVIRKMAERAIDPVATVRDNVQKILRRQPHHMATLKLLGDIYREHGKYTEMIHSYSLYLSHGGEETEEIDRSLAGAYLALKDYDSAERFVRHLLKTGAADTELLIDAIPMALDTGRAEHAADYIDRLEELDPNSLETKKLRKQVDRAIGEQRLDVLKKQLDDGKGGADVLQQLGDIASQAENYSEAIAYFQRGSRDLENPIGARLCRAKLAWCYMKKRLDDMATETLKEITINIEDSEEDKRAVMDILYDIAVMFVEYKLYHRAERVFKLLVKIDAGYRDVLERMEKLRG